MNPRPARPRPTPLGTACPRPPTTRPALSGLSPVNLPLRLRSSLPRGCGGAGMAVQVFEDEPSAELAADLDASRSGPIPWTIASMSS